MIPYALAEPSWICIRPKNNTSISKRTQPEQNQQKKKENTKYTNHVDFTASLPRSRVFAVTVIDALPETLQTQNYASWPNARCAEIRFRFRGLAKFAHSAWNHAENWTINRDAANITHNTTNVRAQYSGGVHKAYCVRSTFGQYWSVGCGNGSRDEPRRGCIQLFSARFAPLVFVRPRIIPRLMSFISGEPPDGDEKKCPPWYAFL